MKINIDDEVLKKENITLLEFIFLLFSAKGGKVGEVMESLISKGLADRDILDSKSVVVSNNTKKLVADMLIDSEKPDTAIDLSALAAKLRDIYPAGRKEGTTYTWRDTNMVIERKLKTLISKYNAKFTEEEAIQATKNYVASFNGNYRFMQLLKYFILKATTNANGDVEVRSEFMANIDNIGQENILKDDWVSSMV